MTADLRIEAVQLACGRAAAQVRWKMGRGRASLMAVASSAAFLGVLATVIGIVTSFRGVSGEKSTAMAFLAALLGQALVPAAASILLAVLAYWGQSYIGRKVEQFDGEMRAATLDLANTLARVFPLKREARPWKWTRRERLAAVRRACERAAAGVRLEMGRRRSVLSSIKSTAIYLGRLGTIVVVPSVFLSTSCLCSPAEEVAWGFAPILVPLAAGILTAILAYWAESYIAAKVGALDAEMHAATLDLMNRLSLLMDSGTNLRPAPATD